jgi:hypothetical protein
VHGDERQEQDRVRPVHAREEVARGLRDDGGGAVQTAKTYGNVEARTYGGEASARIALPAHLFLSGGASYTRGLTVTRGGDLAEMPPLKLVAALRYDVNAFFAEAEEVYAARQDRVDVALQEQPTAAWYITNVRVGIAGAVILRDAPVHLLGAP